MSCIYLPHKRCWQSQKLVFDGVKVDIISGKHGFILTSQESTKKLFYEILLLHSVVRSPYNFTCSYWQTTARKVVCIFFYMRPTNRKDAQNLRKVHRYSLVEDEISINFTYIVMRKNMPVCVFVWSTTFALFFFPHVLAKNKIGFLERLCAYC